MRKLRIAAAKVCERLMMELSPSDVRLIAREVVRLGKAEYVRRNH